MFDSIVRIIKICLIRNVSFFLFPHSWILKVVDQAESDCKNLDVLVAGWPKPYLPIVVLRRLPWIKMEVQGIHGRSQSGCSTMEDAPCILFHVHLGCERRNVPQMVWKTLEVCFFCDNSFVIECYRSIITGVTKCIKDDRMVWFVATFRKQKDERYFEIFFSWSLSEQMTQGPVFEVVFRLVVGETALSLVITSEIWRVSSSQALT